MPTFVQQRKWAVLFEMMIVSLEIFMLCVIMNMDYMNAQENGKLMMWWNTKFALYFLKNCDQLLTNKSPVKENNWYNSTTSRMLIYQQPLHIYKAKNPPSSGSNIERLTSARKPLKTQCFRAFYVLMKMFLQHFCNAQYKKREKEWLKVVMK